MIPDDDKMHNVKKRNENVICHYISQEEMALHIRNKMRNVNCSLNINLSSTHQQQLINKETSNKRKQKKPKL